jgi:hypothetical protein
MASGWFEADLVVSLLLATPFAFWPLQKPRYFLAFFVWG